MRYCICAHDVSLHKPEAGIIVPCIVDGCDCHDFSDTPRKSVRELFAERRMARENTSYTLTIEPQGNMLTGIGYRGWREAIVTGPDGERRRMSIMLTDVE